MTRTPDEQPTMWLKQVPRNNANLPGVWSDKLLPNHMAVGRTTTRPRKEMDEVSISQLRRAVHDFLLAHMDKDNPEMVALKYANMEVDDVERKEWAR